MSDSNVGSRTNKNIRNHIFVVGSIINEATKKKHNVDIEILDYKQCFDSMWLNETVNDLFENGLKNENLNFIYNLNKNNKVAVVTPFGLTDRVNIDNIVMQGENLAPLECSVQVDSFGKECLTNKKNLYLYRSNVEIPPLSMVDDLLCISECGNKSIKMNAFINTKTNIKKLQFGESKCFRIHIGRNVDYCPDLFINKWKVKDLEMYKTNEASVEDTIENNYQIESSNSQKYLGDYITNDGKNDITIEARVSKGYAIIQQIMTILEENNYGNHCFKAVKLFRESLFLNSILLNIEAWSNVTFKNIDNLEKVDNILLRRAFGAVSTTPIVLLHLDLGTLLIKFITMIRRLMFLNYLLSQKETSMISKVLLPQIRDPLKGDWWLQAKQDLQSLSLNYTLHEIKVMSKGAFKGVVKTAAENAAFKWLIERKQKLSKIKHIQFQNLSIQNYLVCDELSLPDKMFLSAARGRMLNLRVNFRNKYVDTYCPLCAQQQTQHQQQPPQQSPQQSPQQTPQYFPDEQQHLFWCESLVEDNEVKDPTILYKHIFSPDINLQVKSTMLLKHKYSKRRLLEDADK